MAWTAPITWSTGQLVTAANLNEQLRDNSNALRTGAFAFASQAIGDLGYASSTSQWARVAAGTSGQYLKTNGVGSAPTWVTPTVAHMLVGGRLSLTTGVPVTTADVTAATTLYFALYGGAQIGLYSGTVWEVFSIAQLSIAVPATTNQMYDVFVDYNAGTPALSLTAWTNDTTRATALTTQDGVLVKTGATGSRFVGCMRTTGVSGQTEDSFAKRFVRNYYNRAPRVLRKIEGTNSWSYTTDSFQQANASAANQVEFLQDIAESPVDLAVIGYALNSGGGLVYAVGIGLDSATVPTANQLGMQNLNTSNSAGMQASAYLRAYPAVGYHFAAWLERSITTSGTTTWYGDNNVAYLQSGIQGVIFG